MYRFKDMFLNDVIKHTDEEGAYYTIALCKECIRKYNFDFDLGYEISDTENIKCNVNFCNNAALMWFDIYEEIEELNTKLIEYRIYPYENENFLTFNTEKEVLIYRKENSLEKHIEIWLQNEFIGFLEA
jgi:hypothetical protein